MSPIFKSEPIPLSDYDLSEFLRVSFLKWQSLQPYHFLIQVQLVKSLLLPVHLLKP